MSHVNIQIEAMLVASDRDQLVLRSLVKVDVKPTDTLRQVISQHGRIKKEGREKNIWYRDAGMEDDPYNKVKVAIFSKDIALYVANKEEGWM